MGALIERTPDRGRSTHTLRAEALFASSLQASDHPSADQVRRAVATTLHRLGTAGCAAHVAGEFGDHPDLAATRMTWVLATIDSSSATAGATPTPAPGLFALAG
jgi:hypothetical protein